METAFGCPVWMTGGAAERVLASDPGRLKADREAFRSLARPAHSRCCPQHDGNITFIIGLALKVNGFADGELAR